MQTRSTKRQKELARAEHRKEKEARRSERERQRKERPTRAPGFDPDIADIIPGPQPKLPEFED